MSNLDGKASLDDLHNAHVPRSISSHTSRPNPSDHSRISTKPPRSLSGSYYSKPRPTSYEYPIGILGRPIQYTASVVCQHVSRRGFSDHS